MRASSSWIKLQFVVRKHVMNTYQMHTLSPSFYSITLSLPVSPSLFHVFGFFLSFWLYILSFPLWISDVMSYWSDIFTVVLYNVLLYMCMCRLCAHAHFLIFRVCNMCTLLCVCPVTLLLLFSENFYALWKTVCKLVHLLWLCILWCLSPYDRPLWGCPHLQTVVEWAWCIRVDRGGPGHVQTGISCMG